MDNEYNNLNGENEPQSDFEEVNAGNDDNNDTTNVSPTYDNPDGVLNDSDEDEDKGATFSNSQNETTSPIVDYSASYVPISKPKANTGIKVFSLVLALLIVAAACLSVGYYYGSNSNSVNNAFTATDLASKPKDTDEFTPAQIYEIGNKSVVGITCYNTAGQGSTATGVIYTEDGYIITNDHIYSEIASPKFKIYTHDLKEYTAEYVAGDTRTDIAVLKIIDTNDKFDAAIFGNSNECFVGENVVAIGRPMDATAKSNLTNGIISLLGARVTASNNYSIKSIQTNSAINPGSSGGALFNMYGQVIGITFSKIAGEEYEGIGYAIPSATAKGVADSLIKNGYVKNRARLGITYYDVDSVAAEIENTTRGLQITSVDAESELYGKLGEGDTITHINDIKITTTDIILDIIESSKPGDKVTLTFVGNNGSVNSVTATLLEDRGSSSYIKNQSGTNNSNQPNNSSEFTFPFGE